MRAAGRLLAFVASLSAASLAPSAHAEGDPSAGRRHFKPCSVCHSLKPGEDRFGPSLAGVFGRRAGSVAGFPYSPALKASGLVWDDATMARWIEAPDRAVPGSAMNFPGLPDAQARANLIAYLREASARAR